MFAYSTRYFWSVIVAICSVEALILLILFLFLSGCQTVIKPNDVNGVLERCEQWTPFILAPAITNPWFDWECVPIDKTQRPVILHR